MVNPFLVFVTSFSERVFTINLKTEGIKSQFFDFKSKPSMENRYDLIGFENTGFACIAEKL